jgi:Squalene-hopene cyclase C-terminal domain/Prenyltransferase and squalene oxidase repeat
LTVSRRARELLARAVALGLLLAAASPGVPLDGAALARFDGAAVVRLVPLRETAGAARAWAGVRLDARDRRALDRMVGFLQDSQNDDGGYGGQPGAASDPMFSAWVGIGLAAAGINPLDQRAPGGGRDLASYVARAGPATRAADGGWVTTELERIGLVANAAGLDPRRFGGRDYVRPLLARQRTAAWRDVAPGWFPHSRRGGAPGVNDTIFAILFLAGVRDPAVEPAIARAAGAVESMQRPDGTWPATQPGGPTDVDMTGAAIQALCAARRCRSARVRAALAWLEAHQQADGGWSSAPLTGESNSGTTAWVVQALWATGIDPRTWRRAGRDPLDFLRSLQRRDGSVRWTASTDANPTWMTAYALPAYAGHAWPVPAPPRERPAVQEPRERGGEGEPRRRERDQREDGRGGAAEHGDGSVAAGGGGSGAPLFSRPQPQSRGATGGGVRDIDTEQQPLPAVRGRNGATGTVAAGGAGDDGGVQNAPRREQAAAPTGQVTGVVIGRDPRGTEGRGTLQAIAPGLASAERGAAGTPWTTIGLVAAAALAFAGGARRERAAGGPSAPHGGGPSVPGGGGPSASGGGLAVSGGGGPSASGGGLAVSGGGGPSASGGGLAVSGGGSPSASGGGLARSGGGGWSGSGGGGLSGPGGGGGSA